MPPWTPAGLGEGRPGRGAGHPKPSGFGCPPPRPDITRLAWLAGSDEEREVIADELRGQVWEIDLSCAGRWAAGCRSAAGQHFQVQVHRARFETSDQEVRYLWGLVESHERALVP